MRSIVVGLVVTSSLLVGCDVETDEPATMAEVVEFPFDQPLGTQRDSVWQVAAPEASDFALSTDDGLFARTDTPDALGVQVHKVPLTDPTGTPLWTYVATGHMRIGNPKIHAAPDGGFVLVGAAEIPAGYPNGNYGIHIARVAEDGAELWTHTIPESRDAGASLLLANGAVAVAFDTTPGAGSISDPEHFVVMIGDGGGEVWRTAIPAEHVESADHPGTPNGPLGPGYGIPVLQALSETSDGGLIVAGYYQFSRAIECGSQLDPTDPVTESCGSSNENGFVGRLAPTGALTWTRRLGFAYDGGHAVFRFVAALSDGSVLATGNFIPESFASQIAHIQALAVRYAADGELQWSKAFPFGPAPGVNLGAWTSFGVVVARDGGTADVILEPPLEVRTCRLLRVEASGEISRVQMLDGDGCEVRPLGSDLAYRNRPPAAPTYMITKLEP